MSFSSKVLSLCFIASMTISSTSFVQADDFDVHGRDMTYRSLPWLAANNLGHIGMEWINRVYNMTPFVSNLGTLDGKQNFLHRDTTRTYTRASDDYWGARNAGSLPYERGTERRIVETIYYGTDYTFNPRYSKSYAYKRGGRTIFVKGNYRCDTFVLSILRAGGYNIGNFSSPITAFNSLPYRS